MEGEIFNGEVKGFPKCSIREKNIFLNHISDILINNEHFLRNIVFINVITKFFMETKIRKIGIIIHLFSYFYQSFGVNGDMQWLSGQADLPKPGTYTLNFDVNGVGYRAGITDVRIGQTPCSPMGKIMAIHM